MPDDYTYRMSDLDFKKFKLRQTVEAVNDDFMTKDPSKQQQKKSNYQDYQSKQFDCNVSDLIESDAEINGGDKEDNVTLDSGSEKSLSFRVDDGKESDEEFNLNVSFTGGYVPNTDLTRVDKGQGNAQFHGLEIKA